MSDRRVDGPTPNGGAYSVITFLDRDGAPVAEGKAIKFELVEFDQEGEGFLHTYGTLFPLEDKPSVLDGLGLDVEGKVIWT